MLTLDSVIMQYNEFTQQLKGKAKSIMSSKQSKRQKRINRKLAEKQNRISELTKANQEWKVKNQQEAKPIESKPFVMTPSTTQYKGSVNSAQDWQRFVSDHTHYPTMVCSLGQLNIWAATKSEILLSDMRYIDLVVNCSQIALTIGKAGSKLTGNRAFHKLNKHVRKVNEVVLDWSDGSDLPVGLAFWQEFYDICIAEGFRNIVFCCMGGHGRTGTGIACLVLANSQYAFNMSEHIIDLVRERYCQNSIETMTQENYLEDLEREKKDLGCNRCEPVTWLAYSPKLRKDGKYGGYTTWQGANTQTNNLTPKTLSEVIAQANKQIDIFDGKGDRSAEQLNSMEESQAANASIVIDMLTAEERAKVNAKKSEEDLARQETLDCIQAYEDEQKELEKVKAGADDWQCYCDKDYECLSCEYNRMKGGE